MGCVGNEIFFMFVAVVLSACSNSESHIEVQGVSSAVPHAYNKENDYLRKQRNIEKADITQDRIEDYIVAAMYFSPKTKVTEVKSTM